MEERLKQIGIRIGGMAVTSLLLLGLAAVAVKTGEALLWWMLALVFVLICLFGVWAHKRVLMSRQELENARVNESAYRIAAAHSNIHVFQYNLKDHSVHMTYEDAQGLYCPSVWSDMPEGVITTGMVCEESADTFRRFFAIIDGGAKEADCVISVINAKKNKVWLRMNYTLLPGQGGTAPCGIISSEDVTVQRERELAYEKWRQALDAKAPETFALYEYNLTRDVADHNDGALLDLCYIDLSVSFSSQVEAFASRFVHSEDTAAFLHFMDRDRLLAGFVQGNRADELEFRLLPGNGQDIRWLLLTVQMVEYPGSSDVKGYFLYQDIDEKKRAQLALKARSEEDGLTHALTREVLIERAGQILLREGPRAQHAFLILDLDHFKAVNDTLGHAVGDRTLAEVAGSVRFILRQGDLFGRIGGDEFMIMLRNIPYEAVIERRSRQFCTVIRRMVGGRVPISASIGIAVYPRDGATFEALYNAADAALYHIKSTGKDGYAFYKAGMQSPSPSERVCSDLVYSAPPAKEPELRRHTLLIADASAKTRSKAAQLLQKEYKLIEADSGTRAITQLCQYGAGISLALIDMSMPDMSITQILSSLLEHQALSSIPIIVMGESDGDHTGLVALETGAADFLRKPFTEDELKLKVQAAVARSENDRLRIQNGYLLLQSEEEERYRSVVRSTGTIVFEYDWINGVFSYDALTSQFLVGSYDERPLWRILLSDGVTDTDTAKSMQRYTLQVANRVSSMTHLDALLKTAQGKPHWFRMRVMRMKADLQMTGRLLITLNDVDEEVRTMRKLVEMAELDSLTGLYNRSAFMKKAAELIGSHPPQTYMMLYLDLDNFKVINDRFGHGEGDRLLKHLAIQMRKDAGESGLCCRINADLFAILSPAARGEALTREIWADYRASMEDAPLSFEITMSFGLYLVDDPALPVSVILDRASIAHHSVKGNYSKRFAYYDESMRKQLLERQSIEGQMRAALNKGQFVLYLQPQYQLESGKIVGAEALVRWNHPEWGLLSPGRFIPIFEKNGFISDLDAYVWEQTCILLQRWQRENQPFVPVSVNISRMDLRAASLPEQLSQLVKKYDLEPAMLRLEITESAYADDPAHVINAVNSLRQMGFVVEMDDFGSGYSSLNTLKDVPVSVLKLDLRFLTGENVSGRGGSIVNSMVRMAKWLELTVVAEGVETPQQAEYLRSIGCDYAQGYLYCRPVPVLEFEKLVSLENATAPRQLAPAMEIADANAFWNPDSLETLIFNSYVGGAAIIEYTVATEEFQILRANQKYMAALNADAEAFQNLRLHPMDVMPDRDRQLYIVALRQAISTHGENTCVTRRIFKKNGSETVIWLRSRIRPLSGDSVRHLFYVAIDDITAEKNAQQRLRSSQEALLAAATHTRLYYWVYDMADNSSTQGPLSQNNFGIPEHMEDYPESLIRTGFIHPDYVDTYRKIHQDLKAGALEVSAEILSRWEDGYEWRCVKYTSVYDSQGNRTKAIGTSESLAAYKELEARFTTTAKQWGILTWIYDLTTRQIILEDSSAFQQAIPPTLENVPESTIAAHYVHPEDVPALRQLYEQLSSGQKNVTAVIRFRKQTEAGDDCWAWIRLSYTANINKAGRGNTALGTAMNVSDQMALKTRYEEMLRQFEQEDPSAYVSMGRANITKRVFYIQGGEIPYERQVAGYYSRVPDPGERAALEAALAPDHLIKTYLDGTSRLTMTYRLVFPSGVPRFVNSSIRLFIDPASHDLIAFVFTRDIHNEKMRDLLFQGVLKMNYEFVMDVDAVAGTHHVYADDPAFSGHAFISDGDYDAACRAYIDGIVVPADRELCREALTLSHLTETLCSCDKYSFSYRIEENAVVRSKYLQIFYIDRASSHLCLACTDVTGRRMPSGES